MVDGENTMNSKNKCFTINIPNNNFWSSDLFHFLKKKLSSGTGEAAQELLRKLPADRCVVNSVAAHPSLPLVATAGIDANIKAWDVDVAGRAENFPRRPVGTGERKHWGDVRDWGVFGGG